MNRNPSTRRDALPDLQDSTACVNVPPLLVSTSSNVSTMTIETDMASPSSTGPTSAPMRPRTIRLNSSESLSASSDGSGSLDITGLVKGSKRTASGVVKLSLQADAYRPVSQDLNATEDLKTRLKYAMFKINNGLERQSIEEIETMSPSSPMSRLSRRASISSDSYMISPMAQPSPFRRSQLLQGPFHTLSTAAALMAVAGSSSYDPDLQSMSQDRKSKRRSWAGRPPPPMLSKSSMKHSSDGLHVPSTPTRTTASLLQNQAEKDAVASLMFMSSPNNSKNTNYVRPKRVDFEMPNDRYA